jgi:O-antigen/teichoic acid export membrane protein
MTASDNGAPVKENPGKMSERRLVFNALAAVLNVVLGSLLLFLLYRFLLRQLGPDTLGVWSLLVASVGIARLSDLGVAASATRFVAVARAQGDDREAAHVAETATVTLLILGVLAAAVAMAFLPQLLVRFLPASQLEAAGQALPFALAALATGLAGSAIQSALDGCQRVDLRVWISLAGQVVLVVAAIPWSRRYGLAGVSAAQVLQSLVVLAGSWAALRGQLGELSVVPLRWRCATFRRILSYSALFQLNGVLLLILDPLVKFMLARFGGLSATAYFDMASQLIQRLRQLPVAATQVLVPAIAQANESGEGRVRELYTRSYRTIFAATIPSFCLVAILVPAISIVWIGHREPLFEGVAWICLLGMAVNTLGTPSYFSNLGTGAMITNTVGHGLATVLTAALGWWGGILWNAYGVSAGYVTGLAVGGLYIQLVLMKRLRLELPTLIPAESRWLLTLCVVAVVVGIFADHAIAQLPWFRTMDMDVQLVRIAVLITVFSLVAGASLWSHPLRRIIAGRVMEAIA